LILLFVFKIINTSDLFSIPIIKWIFTQITFFQFWTPEILRSWGTGTPNGSLWTITVEIQFYILLPIVVLSFRKIGLMYKFIFLFIASVLFNIYISNLLENGESNIVKLWGVSVFPYLYCFLSGAILYLCWPKIRNVIEGKAIYWLLVFLAFSIFTDNSPSYFPNNIQIISNILLSILTISLAYTLPNLGKILKGNDISYGMYIYHMLVINSLIAIGFVGQVKYLLMAITLTIILSSLSWFLIEKKALSLKKKIK